MHAGLDPGDRRILIAAGALLLVLSLATALVAPAAAPQREIASSYSSASAGGKAAWLLLGQLGYDTRRWEEPPQNLPEEAAGVVLVLADPVLDVSAGESEAIREFMERGGRVLTTGVAGRDLMPGWEETSRSFSETEWKRYKALVPSPLARGAPEISIDSGMSLPLSAELPLGIYGDTARMVVAAQRVGDGEFIWWAAAAPLTTAGLKEPGNLELLLNCIGPPEVTVYWDEYYHGYRGSLWTYLGATPVPWGLVHAGVLLAALVAARGRRWGPPRVGEEPQRTSPLEFVETVAGLYQRAGVASGAVEIAHENLRHELTQRLGLPASAPARVVADAAAAQIGWNDRDVFEVLEACEAAQVDERLEGRRALALVRKLQVFSLALRRGSEPILEGEA